jgi:hypothetical protein
MTVNGQLHAPVVLSPVKEPPPPPIYLLDRVLVRPQSEEERIPSLPLSGIEPRSYRSKVYRIGLLLKKDKLIILIFKTIQMTFFQLKINTTEKFSHIL